jgi:hypothetical protein
VNDLFGRVAHDVGWHELRGLAPVGRNAYAFVVVGWILDGDEGCMPDTYGVKPDDLMNLMWEYWNARQPATQVQSPAFEAF